MVITESLAKGLKSRFFNEIDEEIKKCTKLGTYAIERMKHTPSGWRKLVLGLHKSLDRCGLATHEGGSKRKPYFGYCTLAIIKDKEYNNWHEKCLTAAGAIFSYNPVFAHVRGYSFNIGEHAITRLYQRGKIGIYNETQIDIYSIIPELKLLPIWASYWQILISELRDENNLLADEICPVFPARSGLFLAQYNNETSEIEIRTFVDDIHLDAKQLYIKNLMIKASDGLQSSPMALYPAVQSFKLDRVELQLAIMSFRIVKGCEEIIDLATQRITNNDLKSKDRIILKDWIKNNVSVSQITEELSEEYKDSNIRVFNNSCREQGIKNNNWTSYELKLFKSN